MDDLDQASAELACGGAELLGQPESHGTWTRLTFRAPRGDMHSLGARMVSLAGKKTLIERARHAAEATTSPRSANA